MFSWFKKKKIAVPLLSLIKKGFYEENDPFSAIHEDTYKMQEQMLYPEFGADNIPVETKISFLYVRHFCYSSMYVQGSISDEDYALVENSIMNIIISHWDIITKRGLSDSKVDSIEKSVMADVVAFIYSYDNRLNREAILNVQVMAEKQIAIFTALYKAFLDQGNTSHLAMAKSSSILTPDFCIKFLNKGGWDRVNDDFDSTVEKVVAFKQKVSLGGV